MRAILIALVPLGLFLGLPSVHGEEPGPRVATAVDSAQPRQRDLVADAVRRLIDAASINDFGAQLDAERDTQASLVAGPEPEEAVRAFLGKRAPNFTALNRKS